MFEKRQVRVAAGLLYGGTYGILLGGLHFRLYWSERAGIAEPDMVMVLVEHLMAGLVSGVVFGIVFGLKPRALSAWAGSLGLGLLGVYASQPILRPLLASSPKTLDWAGPALCQVFPYVGMFLGPALERWVRSSDEEPPGGDR